MSAIQQSATNSFDTMIRKVRGQDVMLDSELAEVYGIGTKRINEAVNRNIERFPEAFSFQLTEKEWDILRSQIATSSFEHGGRRYLPRAFTEHGAVMLATVLNSPRAIEASKDIVRAFVRLRHMTDSGKAEEIRDNPELLYQLAEGILKERGRRELLEEREAIFGNRTPYGAISETTGLPRTEPTRGYLRGPRTRTTTTITTTITERQLRLFDWE